MNTAQPALLYLCPFLIITSIITSLIRSEFSIYWSGEPIKKLTLESEAAASVTNNRDQANSLVANNTLTNLEVESVESGYDEDEEEEEATAR
jgi:hypothetical protein